MVRLSTGWRSVPPISARGAEDELALVHGGVRESECLGVEDLLVVEEEVEIEGARPLCGRRPSRTRPRSLLDGEHCPRAARIGGSVVSSRAAALVKRGWSTTSDRDRSRSGARRRGGGRATRGGASASQSRGGGIADGGERDWSRARWRRWAWSRKNSASKESPQLRLLPAKMHLLFGRWFRRPPIIVMGQYTDRRGQTEDGCAGTWVRRAAGLVRRRPFQRDRAADAAVEQGSATWLSSHAERSRSSCLTRATCMAWPARSATTRPWMRRPARARSPMRSRTLWRTNSSGKRSGPFLIAPSPTMMAQSSDTPRMRPMLRSIGSSFLEAEGARGRDELGVVAELRDRR